MALDRKEWRCTTTLTYTRTGKGHQGEQDEKSNYIYIMAWLRTFVDWISFTYAFTLPNCFTDIKHACVSE